MAGAKLRLCLVQAPCVVGDVQANLKTLVGKVEELKQDADIIVFAELFTSGYMFPAADAEKLSETKDGESFQVMSKCARKNNVAIIYNFPEKDPATRKRYISSMFLDKTGAELVCYRKTHLWDPTFDFFERAVFVDGDSLCPIIPFPCDGGTVNIGLLVCWDVEHPEPARALALSGADLIIVCAANTDLDTVNLVVRARALENLAYVAYCNMMGDPFCGNSQVAAPTSEVVERLGNDEGHVVVVVEPQNPAYVLKRERNQFFRDRQARLYKVLAEE